MPTAAAARSTDTSIVGTAELIAHEARSMRVQLTRDGHPSVAGRDLARVVELIELMATDMADLARRLGH